MTAQDAVDRYDDARQHKHGDLSDVPLAEDFTFTWPHDAEDLVQETLLAAWRGLVGFEGRASSRSRLYRIATNRCLNALRDRGRRPPDPPPPPDDPQR